MRVAEAAQDQDDVRDDHIVAAVRRVRYTEIRIEYRLPRLLDDDPVQFLGQPSRRGDGTTEAISSIVGPILGAGG